MIQAFGSQGFIMVSIPARSGSWGVIIVDFTSQGRKLTRRDAVVIERLSQQIGVALDKQADLDREKTLRGQFQKYAPSALIYATKSKEDSENSIIGASQKEVGALFVDIRGFTALAENLPPAKTFEILGGLFTRVDEAVRSHDGVIDKYLGDGALALWGTLGSSEPNATRILSCIDEILKSVEEYGDKLEDQGIKRLKIGIGAHLGGAIVGTIGSNERLEYTAIGPAINLASRLEGLCKILKAKVVVSEKIAKEAGIAENLRQNQNWIFHSHVQVRGLSETINVWTMKDEEQINKSKMRTVA